MAALAKQKVKILHSTYDTYRILFADGQTTNVHVARYLKSQVRPRVVYFKEDRSLLDWCEEHGVKNAMGGGFFLREARRPLGDLWINGQKQATIPFTSPWDNKRGSLYINPEYDLKIAARYLFPQSPKSDLLQAGPLLVQNGKSVIKPGKDPEGFSAAKKQFDSDITDGRYPRSAIGVDKRYIYSVVCDGYGKGEAGLTFEEFADFLVNLGCIDALNLDGGSSSTLINDGKLRNRPITGSPVKLFPRGRAIHTAIIFD